MDSSKSGLTKKPDWDGGGTRKRRAKQTLSLHRERRELFLFSCGCKWLETPEPQENENSCFYSELDFLICAITCFI
jgi:hypothetical protein